MVRINNSAHLYGQTMPQGSETLNPIPESRNPADRISGGAADAAAWGDAQISRVSAPQKTFVANVVEKAPEKDSFRDFRVMFLWASA